jgi:hypothetical protein
LLLVELEHQAKDMLVALGRDKVQVVVVAREP